MYHKETRLHWFPLKFLHFSFNSVKMAVMCESLLMVHLHAEVKTDNRAIQMPHSIAFIGYDFWKLDREYKLLIIRHECCKSCIKWSKSFCIQVSKQKVVCKELQSRDAFTRKCLVNMMKSSNEAIAHSQSIDLLPPVCSIFAFVFKHLVAIVGNRKLKVKSLGPS